MHIAKYRFQKRQATNVIPTSWGETQQAPTVFKPGFSWLGDMPNEFQRLMDRMTEKKPNTHFYLDDILIATVGSEDVKKN